MSKTEKNKSEKTFNDDACLVAMDVSSFKLLCCDIHHYFCRLRLNELYYNGHTTSSPDVIRISAIIKEISKKRKEDKDIYVTAKKQIDNQEKHLNGDYTKNKSKRD